MKRQLLTVLLAALLFPSALQAKEVVAKVGLKDFTGFRSHRTTRADSKQAVLATLKYEQLPAMEYGRTKHQMFPTANGGFVVVGGSTTDYVLTATAELWQNGSWKTLPIGATHVEGFSARLSDGRVMVGGCQYDQTGSSMAKKTEIYNPATQSFTAGPDMTLARGNCKAIVVGDKLLVSGNGGGGKDNVMDYYDGSAFKAVGDMDNRYRPYLFYRPDGHVVSMSYLDNNEEPTALYTFDDGSKMLLADSYDLNTGKTEYVGTPYNENIIPMPLSADISSSDYHFTHNGESFYLILAAEVDESLEDGFRYLLLLYSADEAETYAFGSLEIPMRHPETGATIDYRGGVIVNEAKQEAYLIGHSGYYEDETLYILSFNYVTEEWTLASAPGFSHDMTETAAWTLLSDGRLACTGGIVMNKNPSQDAYIFAPPVAGRGDETSDEPLITGNTLVITTKDGVQTTFLLSEKPQVKFIGENLRVVSTKTDVTYKMTDILRFTYLKKSASGIDEVADNDPADVDYKDGQLVISGIKAGAAVGVYSLDGKLVRQLTAHHAGTYRLSLSALPQGVYIVKADNVTYKIMKR